MSSATPMGGAVTCRKRHSNSPLRTRFLRRSWNAPLNAVRCKKKSKTTEQKRSHKSPVSNPSSSKDQVTSLAVARIISLYNSKDQQPLQ
ncbi:hypothetical protein ACLKA7_005629 [Drosophila subpalustris]